MLEVVAVPVCEPVCEELGVSVKLLAAGSPSRTYTSTDAGWLALKKVPYAKSQL